MGVRLGVVALALGLLAAPAAAQDEKVLRDEWQATFRGKRKIAWEHQRLLERPGGFVIEEEGWLPTAEGQVRSTLRVETDPSGRVLRRDATIAAPWGDTAVRVEPGEDGVLRYRVALRDLPPVEGTLEEAWSGDVLRALVLRGAQPPGKRTVRMLDLPGDGTEERELDLQRDGEGWKVGSKSGASWWTREGCFVRGETKNQPELSALPAKDGEHAADLAVTADDRPAEETHLAASGLRVDRPGPDWSLMREEEANGMVMLGTEHPSGVATLVMVLPMRLPADGKARLRMAEVLREGINGQAKKSASGDGPDLGSPELATWQDRPAVRYAVGGKVQLAPAAGEAFLVGLDDGKAAMVLFGWAQDQAEARAATIAQARAAVSFGKADAAPWKRWTVGDVTLELPADWTQSAGETRLKSAIGASQVNVSSDRLPAGVDLADAQEMWVAQQQNNPNLTGAEVERQEEVVVDGKTARLAVVRARLRERNGVAPAMRAASCAILREDGSYVEVVVVAFDLDWELAGLDRALESIRWIEER